MTSTMKSPPTKTRQSNIQFSTDTTRKTNSDGGAAQRLAAAWGASSSGEYYDSENEVVIVTRKKGTPPATEPQPIAVTPAQDEAEILDPPNGQSSAQIAPNSSGSDTTDATTRVEDPVPPYVPSRMFDDIAATAPHISPSMLAVPMDTTAVAKQPRQATPPTPQLPDPVVPMAISESAPAVPTTAVATEPAATAQGKSKGKSKEKAKEKNKRKDKGKQKTKHKEPISGGGQQPETNVQGKSKDKTKKKEKSKDASAGKEKSKDKSAASGKAKEKDKSGAGEKAKEKDKSGAGEKAKEKHKNKGDGKTKQKGKHKDAGGDGKAKHKHKDKGVDGKDAGGKNKESHAKRTTGDRSGSSGPTRKRRKDAGNGHKRLVRRKKFRFADTAAQVDDDYDGSYGDEDEDGSLSPGFIDDGPLEVVDDGEDDWEEAEIRRRGARGSRGKRRRIGAEESDEEAIAAAEEAAEAEEVSRKMEADRTNARIEEVARMLQKEVVEIVSKVQAKTVDREKQLESSMKKYMKTQMAALDERMAAITEKISACTNSVTYSATVTGNILSELETMKRDITELKEPVLPSQIAATVTDTIPREARTSVSGRSSSSSNSGSGSGD